MYFGPNNFIKISLKTRNTSLKS